MRNLIRIQKKCEWCGNEFTAYKCSTRFCCKRCNEHAYKDRLRKQKVQNCQDEISKNENVKTLGNIPSKEFLTPREVGMLFGLDRVTIYRYLWDGYLSCIQFKGKTFIRRQDIDKLFDESRPYQKRQKKERAPITEFYTTAEVEQKFSVGTSWVFKVAKDENIPKVFHRGKTLWSKNHFDAYFSKKAPNQSINEWYSVEDIKSNFNMTTNAVYSFVSKFNIPKKKVKREVFYSKVHVDAAKNKTELETPQYYTIPEATAKYNMTRDQLYHYVKWHNISKIKEGKYTKISRKELDDLLAPPLI